MDKNKAKNKSPQVISFVSGKGGSGKTSVTIALSYLLKEIGFNVLLIDFDFSTNGSSYFFKYDLQKQKTNGFEGLLSQNSKINLSTDTFNSEIQNHISNVKNGFDFLPSRIKFNEDLNIAENISNYSNQISDILNCLISYSYGKYDFILLDNQAGANNTSKISSKASDKVIIVSELDPISNDAVDSLFIQIGDSFPSFRRHLINKLHIDESKEYKDLDVLFQSFNRLPPLPFDLKIRAAFSSRKIPMESGMPTTFSMALLNTVKSLLPEFESQIQNYEDSIRNQLDAHKKKMDLLIDKRNELVHRLENRKKKTNTLFTKYLTIIGSVISVFALIITFLRPFIEDMIPKEVVFTDSRITASITAIAGGLIVSLIINTIMRQRTKVEDLSNVMSELHSINVEIDNYKSYLMTKTGSYLLDYIK